MINLTLFYCSLRLTEPPVVQLNKKDAQISLLRLIGPPICVYLTIYNIIFE